MTTASAFIIETTESAVGVVVLQDDGYRFFASNPVRSRSTAASSRAPPKPSVKRAAWKVHLPQDAP